MTAATMGPTSGEMTRGESRVGARVLVLAWAAVLGLASSLACVSVRLLFRGLQWVFTRHSGLPPDAAAHLSVDRRVITPIAGAILATAVLWAIRRWSKAKRFEEYVEAVRMKNGRIPFLSTLWRTMSSAFSVATGAAVGREGSMIQFATATTSWVGSRSPVRTFALSRQVACGAAAAVAAAYQAPLAGVFFASEIVLGEWVWAELPQLLIASFVGWITSRLILGGGPLFAVNGIVVFSSEALWAAPLAVLLGLLGPVYQVLLRSLRFTREWPMPLVIGGIVVGALSIFEPAVWGNGDGALLRTLQHSPALPSLALLLLIRLVATTTCIGTGTVGGVFTPTLFAGAAIGLLAGQAIHAGEPLFLAVVGLSAFLAAVTHAPFMAAFMAVELTGQWHLLPLALILNGLSSHVASKLSHRSLYAIASSAPTDDEPAMSSHLVPHAAMGD